MNAGIHILEGLILKDVPEGVYDLIALPMSITVDRSLLPWCNTTINIISKRESPDSLFLSFPVSGQFLA
jgi:hypothetical protein